MPLTYKKGKSGGQTDRQTNKQTNRQTKHSTPVAHARAWDNKNPQWLPQV